MNNQKHEMILEETHSSGAEEWYCPTCGRRMTIFWDPWKKIVLEPGDIFAAHSASKGGLRIDSLQIVQAKEDSAQSPTDSFIEDDPYLTPWLRWLNKVDSDDLWYRET